MINELHAKIHKVKSHYRAHEFEMALTLLRELGDCRKISPYLLAFEATLIQLQPANGTILEEAESCLLEAYAINPKDTDVLCELAHYYDAVDDNAQKASQFARLLQFELERLAVGIEEIANGALPNIEPRISD